MILKHRATTATPNVLQIAEKNPEISKVLSEIIALIQETNRNIYDDLKSLKDLEVVTVLPAASDEYRGHAVVLSSGSSPDQVKICLITGVSPTAYGWKDITIT